MTKEPQQKLNRAEAILKEYAVAENLSYFIADLRPDDVPGLQISRDKLAKDEKDRRLLVLDIHFEGIHLKLVESDITLPLEYDDLTSSNVTLTVDGMVVLKTGMLADSKGWFSGRVQSGAYWITAFRPGPWMETLSRACDATKAAYETRKAKEEQEKLEQQAAEVDLGEYE